jgi:hypothetical protein
VAWRRAAAAAAAPPLHGGVDGPGRAGPEEGGGGEGVGELDEEEEGRVRVLLDRAAALVSQGHRRLRTPAP